MAAGKGEPSGAFFWLSARPEQPHTWLLPRQFCRALRAAPNEIGHGLEVALRYRDLSSKLMFGNSRTFGADKSRQPQHRAANCDTCLMSKPSLHRRLAQSWWPLGLSTNSSPHSAQNICSNAAIGCSSRSTSGSTELSFKKEPAGRAAGLSFIGKRRAPGATAIWRASTAPLIEAQSGAER